MLVITYEEDLPYGEIFVPKEPGVQKPLYMHFNRDYPAYVQHALKHEFRHYMSIQKSSRFSLKWWKER